MSVFRVCLRHRLSRQDFPIIVDNSTVGGDSGAFYTPYILDPQNSGELLVGTCRVWRGTTSGAGFSVLSPNFETGTVVALAEKLTWSVRWPQASQGRE